MLCYVRAKLRQLVVLLMPESRTAQRTAVHVHSGAYAALHMPECPCDVSKRQVLYP